MSRIPADPNDPYPEPLPQAPRQPWTEDRPYGWENPQADHDDTYTDDGEVRCAGCKQILPLDRRGVVDHQCPTTTTTGR